MNKAVQILMLAAMIPFAGNAREETLEERKQRITRKYLRENTKLAQSEMYVPTDVIEDEQVTGSEQFKEIAPQFERQEAGTRPPPRPQRPVPVQQTTENWLLADPSLDEDPYSNDLDPYGSSRDAESDYWSLFGGRPGATQPPESSRKRPAYDPYANRNRNNSTRDQGIFGSGQAGSGRTGIFGQRQGEALQGNLGNPAGIGSRARRTYGSSPESGLLDTPFPQRGQAETERSRESQQYVPHKSPYQTDRTQRGQQRGPQTPQIEYTKPDAFKQWKDRNKSWDPTGDDAYLDELMQKNRR